MNYLEEVQKGINYIEANLDYDISLQKVSQKAGISQWHFQRIFRALTNETLKTYIRTRRLSRAFGKLLNTNQKIIEVAVVAGFESQESFTRAFKKVFNMTPYEARKISNSNLFLNKIEFNTEYLLHINNSISLVPEIYTEKKMQFVGMKTQFYSVDSEKNNIADKLPSLWEAFLPRMLEIKDSVPGAAYGIIQQTEDKTDLLEYYSVCEVSQISNLPAEMISLVIPESNYARKIGARAQYFLILEKTCSDLI